MVNALNFISKKEEKYLQTLITKIKIKRKGVYIMKKTEKRKSEILKKQRKIWTIAVPILILTIVLMGKFAVTGALNFEILQILGLIIIMVMPACWVNVLFSISVSEEERREKEKDEYDRRVKELKRNFSKKLVHVKILHNKNFFESYILEQVEGMFSFYYFASMQDNQMVLYIKNENHETIGKPIYISNLAYFWKTFDFEGKSEYK